MIWDQWGGAAAVADASLIPDFSMVEDSVTVRIVRGYTTLEAPYEFDPDCRCDALGSETARIPRAWTQRPPVILFIRQTGLQP